MQIVGIVALVVLLVVLWRVLGDRAATPGAGRGGRGGGGEVVPVELAAVTQQDVPIQIKSIGNRIRHEYFRIDDAILWQIVTIEAPSLKTVLETMLARRGTTR